MRLAGNSSLEWGYLAPASSFVRAARAVVVATAIGAFAGAAVIFSLVDGPRGEETVAGRTLVHPVDSGVAAVPSPIANAGPMSPAASQWSGGSTTPGPAITDTAPAQIRTAATVVPSAKPERKPVPIKKLHYTQRSAPRYAPPARGPFAFLHLFSRSPSGEYWSARAVY